MSNLVIRLSSLGDVVLAGAITGQLRPVTFLTSRRYLDIAASLPGVTEVLAWEDSPQLHARDYAHIIDLHASMRSRWLTRGMGARRVARHDLTRRLRVALKRAPAPSVPHRYAQAAGLQPAPLPWLDCSETPDTLLLIPGAAHATKHWAPEKYAEIRQRWMARGGRVCVMGSQSETALCQQIAGETAEVLAEDGFEQTLQRVRNGVAALGGDTGLMHLATAAGVPSLVIFGPTTAHDGFWSHGGYEISVPLSCRPCSRHGNAACPLGDHHCMQTLTVDAVWSKLCALGQS